MKVINGNYREFQLDNGLVVALQETPTFTIFEDLIVHYGAINEEENQKGLAHLLDLIMILIE